DAYTSRAGSGRGPAVVKVYGSLGESLDAGSRAGSSIRAIAAAGHVPMLTIEPTWYGDTRDLLARIARGDADSLICARAAELRTVLPSGSIIELAPEMNARFGAPWQPRGDSVGRDSLIVHDYIAAWRRIVRLARE